MSYDLFLKRDPALEWDAFTWYFRDNTNCRVEKGQLLYGNNDTGVYFLFEPKAKTEASDDGPNYQVAFNINFYRPHFFGLEAVDVLADVVRHFGLSIAEDPQGEMADGHFSRERFLQGWNHGNEVGHRRIPGKASPGTVHSKPTAVLEAIWRWNFARARVQTQRTDEVYVPKVFWIMVGKALKSAIVWTDGIPTVMPEVDILLVLRKEFAPSRWLRKKEEDWCLLPQTAIGDFYSKPIDGKYPLPCLEPRYQAVPKPLRRVIESLTKMDEPLKVVPMESVLNTELL